MRPVIMTAMEKAPHPLVRSRFRAAAVAVVAVVGLVVWALAAIPRYQAHGVSFEGRDTSAKEAALINEYRRTLVQVIGGVFVVVGALSGAYFTLRQITVAHEGQITDRFTKAIAQLGDDTLAVRVGGIYALERIARDSLKDQWTIVETLSAFIRESAPAPATTADIPMASRTPDTLPSLRADVQAALTVLGRRNPISEPGTIDLRRTALGRANLNGAHLEGASLREAHLKQASVVSQK
jgi:hypothetical protein